MATVVHTQTITAPLEVDDSHHASLVREPTGDSQSRSQPKNTPSQILGSPENVVDAPNGGLSRTRAVILITTLTGITFVGSMSGGLLTIGLPWIAADLSLPDNLLLW